MPTGIICTTRTFSGRPCTVYPTAHLHPYLHLHNIQQQNNNHTQIYCELFHQTIHKRATHKTNRFINRATHKIRGYNFTLTTTQVEEAIKQSKNNNSQGPNKLNSRYLKHKGALGLAFMLKTALNTT